MVLMINMLYNINSLKVGLKVLQNKEPCVIISNEFVKPGKGLAFNRIRLKNIISGKILEKTLKSGEFLESADITEVLLIYLYFFEEFWYFMNEKNFEQIHIHSKILKNSVKWMVEQLRYVVTFWNKHPILVTPPDCIQLKIIKTSLSITKNSSSSSGMKEAVVSTGAIIKVPIFIQPGEVIKVNTKSGTYISRVK